MRTGHEKTIDLGIDEMKTTAKTAGRKWLGIRLCVSLPLSIFLRPLVRPSNSTLLSRQWPKSTNVYLYLWIYASSSFYLYLTIYVSVSLYSNLSISVPLSISIHLCLFPFVSLPVCPCLSLSFLALLVTSVSSSYLSLPVCLWRPLLSIPTCLSMSLPFYL